MLRCRCRRGCRRWSRAHAQRIVSSTSLSAASVTLVSTLLTNNSGMVRPIPCLPLTGNILKHDWKYELRWLVFLIHIKKNIHLVKSTDDVLQASNHIWLLGTYCSSYRDKWELKVVTQHGRVQNLARYVSKYQYNLIQNFASESGFHSEFLWIKVVNKFRKSMFTAYYHNET